MNIEEICSNLEPEKTCRDIININYPKKDDYSICDYALDHIPSTNIAPYHGIKIFKNYAIKKSLKQFKIFSEENNQNLLSIINKTDFIQNYPLYNYGVRTTYDIIPKYNKIQVITPGYISAYHMPKKIYIVDIISLGHEHCHALKETNYKEHQNALIIGEVIPIFYELINYENDFLRIKYLQNRLFFLNEQKEIYLELKNQIKTNNTNEIKSIYEYTKSLYSSYLGGFYYALTLYSMYKKDPLKILNMVNDVLSHKITTIDMLKRLNLYRSILGQKFEYEITNMKKVLSK